ncbi:c-type cytochrome [Arenibaculum pallidiluteum]|uniref:c-type cytochrome n=1 Tax=Arenibaculum pallidiluteum TaxID=2812559 RepID=UPI001A96987C|nr:cytochrome c [Arenibaculum pallidiluteum]
MTGRPFSAALLTLALAAGVGTAFVGIAAAQDVAPGAKPDATPGAAVDATAADAAAVERGAYVFNAAGCVGCHTAKDGQRLAGGRGIETPFGTFYAPNITPDPGTGIGRWTEGDLARALREGRAPDGSAYYPAFPYTSYTAMTDGDVRDLWAYLMAQPAAVQPNRQHELSPPFGWRFLMTAWQALFFDSGPLPDQSARPAEWRRGEYLVRVLGHCGECHTPRNTLGVTDGGELLAGAAKGPEGKPIPNLTPHADGLADWSAGDIATVLEIGMLPDGDFVGGGMNEVVQNQTSKLSAEDRRAIVAYLRDIPALPTPK